MNQTFLYSYRQPQVMSKCVGFGGSTAYSSGAPTWQRATGVGSVVARTRRA